MGSIMYVSCVYVCVCVGVCAGGLEVATDQPRCLPCQVDHCRRRGSPTRLLTCVDNDSGFLLYDIRDIQGGGGVVQISWSRRSVVVEASWPNDGRIGSVRFKEWIAVSRWWERELS